MLKTNLFCLCVLRLAGLTIPSLLQAQASQDWPTFHVDRQRTGWRPNEMTLTPAAVSGGKFGPIWNSQEFDSITIGKTVYSPHLYASPLYLDQVTMTAGAHAGSSFSVVFAATSNAYVYAVNAFTTAGANPVAAGTILWKRRLNTASVVQNLDGGMPLGVLGTPIIDTATNPPRLYVASADATAGWQVFALDVTNGSVLNGWPLWINNSTLAPINRNGPTTFQAASAMSQRGALNLSPDGRLLYVPFGAFFAGGSGWMVAVDTTALALTSAFAGAPSGVAFAKGGMWSSGGPSIGPSGRVYVTTGTGPTTNENTPGYWGQSVLVWLPGTPLTLAGTYTPWNYCQQDMADIDLAGGTPIVLPSLSATSTPYLLTFGGKQGNEYLIDRAHLPGSLSVRQGCGTDAFADLSLLPPGSQPQFGTRGPLNVFGPYSETFGDEDYAKSRSTPAYFHASDGSDYLFVTGSTKQSFDSTTTIPPCIARLKIVTPAGQPAYLAVDQYETTLSLLTPGSPVLTSNGSATPVLWVLVGNVLRTKSLVSGDAPHPILYALDPLTMQILWMSNASQLNVGGKYNTPATARGVVFVGTDRIQAFGITGVPPPTVTSTSLPGGAVGSPYSTTLAATGGTPPYSQWSVTAGALPPGLVLYASTGVISGTPRIATGSPFNFTVTVTDSVGATSSAQPLSIAIAPTSVVTSAVVNGASFLPGLASGAWITIFGSGLSSTTRRWMTTDFINGNLLPTQLDGVSATIDGYSAYIYYISPTQLDVLAPDDPALGPVPVQVTTPQGKSNLAMANKSIVSPAFFLFTPNYPAAVHTSGEYVGKPNLISGSTTTPAKPGETILLFGTGFGLTNPSLPSDQIVSHAAPLANSVNIFIGGQQAHVSFAGLSASGLDQFNVTVPGDLTDGDQPLLAIIGGVPTQFGVFITIQK
jgi:uncharacterized protein (TIGR03437 family)